MPLSEIWGVTDYADLGAPNFFESGGWQKSQRSKTHVRDFTAEQLLKKPWGEWSESWELKSDGEVLLEFPLFLLLHIIMVLIWLLGNKYIERLMLTQK